MNKAMKSYPASERPYERCELYGPESLSDGELLAVIIRSGSKGMNVRETAGAVLEKVGGSLEGLCHTTVSELSEIEGIGRVKAIQLICIAQIARRIWREGVINDKAEFRLEDMVSYYMQELRFLEEEHVHVLMLDVRMRKICDYHAGIGGFNYSSVPSRDIVKRALRNNAANLVLVHNHPSGDPAPSEADWRMARNLAIACNVAEMRLVDSIIIGDGRYFSFKEAYAPDTELADRLFETPNGPYGTIYMKKED